MFKCRKKKMDYKSRLEHKLYLARENPEPVFDLSDCDLKQIPPGIFSLCKVFLKESLYLGNNRLESLSHGGSLSDLKQLLILDLQKNHFQSLPEDIKFLSNLRELYINDNQFKRLPDAVTSLYNLNILDVSNNSLQMLPESFGNLGYLCKLSILGNKKLTKLPKSFSGLRNLKELSLDADKFIYPPSEICHNGVIEIINYITTDCGIPYENPMLLIKNSNEENSQKLGQYDRNVQDYEDKFLQLEKLKIQKQQELLKIENYNKTLQQQELKLHDNKRADKQKLLNDLMQEQDTIGGELIKLQREKEIEKQKLISQLQTEEFKAEKAIVKFLEECKKPFTTQLLEYEKRENARLFEVVNKKQDDLKRQEIINGMHLILEVETKRFQEYIKHKDETMRVILVDEMDSHAYMNNVIETRVKNQENFKTQLIEDDKLQMAAVGRLLERSDVRSWSLAQQVHLVSNQLAKLTSIELDKRKLKVDDQLNDLSQQRVELSNVLIDLLAQKSERQHQLLSTLRKLENIDGSNDEDFWLLQYQRLIDRRPDLIENVQRLLDPELLQGMLMGGVMHCLPFLAPWAYSNETLASVTDSDLLQAGVMKAEERQIILDLISNYMNGEGSVGESRMLTASAPPIIEQAATSEIPVSNNNFSIECVICMDRTCEVLYVPCGHLCTCLECSISVDLCPMCRTNIEKRIKALLP